MSPCPQRCRMAHAGNTSDDPARRTAAPSDGDLIRRVARRDANAFEALYRRYARPVFGLALRRLGDRMRAEDAVQETFAAVWRSARTYQPDRGAGAPWLYAVARNAIVDRAGTGASRPARCPILRPPSRPPTSGPRRRTCPGACTVRSRSFRSNERDVIELAYYGGLSQSEVADFLDIPLGTVKTRTRAGLGRLADLLEGELR